MSITASELPKGTRVAINPQTDRSRKILIEGAVNEVLTKATEHPHGLLVKLETGEIGRVKKILLGSESETQDSNEAR